MAPRNMKPIGNGYIEATCKRCGETFIFAKGDDIFVEVDPQGDTWPLCAKCYDGPRASAEDIEKWKKAREEL